MTTPKIIQNSNIARTVTRTIGMNNMYIRTVKYTLNYSYTPHSVLKYVSVDFDNREDLLNNLSSKVKDNIYLGILKYYNVLTNQELEKHIKTNLVYSPYDIINYDEDETIEFNNILNNGRDLEKYYSNLFEKITGIPHELEFSDENYDRYTNIYQRTYRINVTVFDPNQTTEDNKWYNDYEIVALEEDWASFKRSTASMSWVGWTALGKIAEKRHEIGPKMMKDIINFSKSYLAFHEKCLQTRRDYDELYD